eukprot:gene3490-3986_t
MVNAASKKRRMNFKASMNEKFQGISVSKEILDHIFTEAWNAPPEDPVIFIEWDPIGVQARVTAALPTVAAVKTAVVTYITGHNGVDRIQSQCVFTFRNNEQLLNCLSGLKAQHPWIQFGVGHPAVALGRFISVCKSENANPDVSDWTDYFQHN